MDTDKHGFGGSSALRYLRLLLFPGSGRSTSLLRGWALRFDRVADGAKKRTRFSPEFPIFLFNLRRVSSGRDRRLARRQRDLRPHAQVVTGRPAERTQVRVGNCHLAARGLVGGGESELTALRDEHDALGDLR